MLDCNRLCIDPGNGSPALEYRVEENRIECRVVEAGPEKSDIEKPWKTVSSQELSSHVMSGTVVAHWLQRRIGYRRLLLACNQDVSFATETPDRSYPKAA
jgi:hypothetical protein